MLRYFILLTAILFFHLTSFSQTMEDLLNEQTQPEEGQEVYATFKTTRIISSQSIETLKKKMLDFRVSHRFGNVGAASGGGYETFFGLDNASNIRIALEYGIRENLMIGVGRNKTNKHVDGFVKWGFLTQTSDNKKPVSIAWFSNAAIKTGKDVNDQWNSVLHRVSYTHQLIIARKFGEWVSLQLTPSYVHRNFIIPYVNSENGVEDTHDIFALGLGGRVRLTKRSAIIFDYYYNFSEFRAFGEQDAQRPYYMPFGIGYEIETGGHVFHVNFTNNAGIIPNDFLVDQSQADWFMGGFKLGFNISRVFQF